MKLGTETGSIVNHYFSRCHYVEPFVGQGATLLWWSDRHAATVIAVFYVGKSLYVKVQRDHAKRIDDNGMSESQDYEYTPNPEGSTHTFRHREGRSWEGVYKSQETGRWKKLQSGRGLLLGHREQYHDFSF